MNRFEMLPENGICLPIVGPTVKEAACQIREAQKLADLMEIRVDRLAFDSADLEQRWSIPWMATLRSKRHGGGYGGSVEEQRKEILRLAKMRPDFLDVELEVLRTLQPKELKETQIVVSLHAASFDPETDLSLLMQHTAAIYKLVSPTADATEGLKLMQLAKSCPVPVLLLGTGKGATVTRLLAGSYGGVFNFAGLDCAHKSAPDQLVIGELIDRYRYRSLSQTTKLYGLIGDPVIHSKGPVVHNSVFRDRQMDACYMTLRVAGGGCRPFFDEMRDFPFEGLSVTMPLKQEVIACVDELAPSASQAGAVNTVVKDHGRWIGHNTDGVGALDAIERRCPVKGKHVVVMGAGGAARAIVAEAMSRGASVTIFNRTVERAESLARERGCSYGALNDCAALAKQKADVLINATSVGMLTDELPIALSQIDPLCLVMDVVNKKRTALLAGAEKIGCPVVNGLEMFIEQAIYQHQIWWGGDDTQALRKVIVSSLCL